MCLGPASGFGDHYGMVVRPLHVALWEQDLQQAVIKSHIT